MDPQEISPLIRGLSLCLLLLLSLSLSPSLSLLLSLLSPPSSFSPPPSSAYGTLVRVLMLVAQCHVFVTDRLSPFDSLKLESAPSNDLLESSPFSSLSKDSAQPLPVRASPASRAAPFLCFFLRDSAPIPRSFDGIFSSGIDR